jgi:RNA polymerase sigma-70 factor (ECF subfamily)
MPKGPVSAEALYAEIAGEYSAAFARLASGYEFNPQHRQDLLQEIHLAIWRSLAIFDHQCSVRTWIYRVAHNTASSYVARKKRHKSLQLCSLEEVDEVLDSQEADALTDRRQTVERLQKLIMRLQPLDRQLMLLYLDDLDAASIASITGLSPKNVATKVHRIKAVLARRFHDGEINNA